MDRIVVDLSPDEVARAVDAGNRRYDYNSAAGRRGTYGADRYGVEEARQVNIDGALGEVAVLQLFAPTLAGLGLDPLSVWRSFEEAAPETIRGDVAGCEVRTRRMRRADRSASAHLILHGADSNEARFIGVMQLAVSRFLILGWAFGREGKRREWWSATAPSPAFFVPARALHPVPSPIPADWIERGAPGRI